MTTDFATICVLSYERPHLLQTTLETIFENANAPFELIIHDDGSTNPTVRPLLEAYRDKAMIITNPSGHNQGQGTALNRMFTSAKGDPIIKCDQDLVYQPNWLAEANRILATNAERTHSHGGREPTIGLLGLCHYFHDPVDMNKTLIRQWQGWQEHPIILGSAFALTREAWSMLGPFEEYSDAFNEDGDMQRRVTETTGFACGLPDRELANNVGMGPGPSTVVHQKQDGSIGVATIHHEPIIHGR